MQGARENTPRARAGQPLTPSRRPRADAARNRERVLDAAKVVFSAGGPGASLEAAARRGADISAEDLLRVLVGMCYMHDQPGWEERGVRLLDVFVDGLCLTPAAASR